jgi:hypothetical protein
MEEIVLLKIFSTSEEAEIMKALLESHEISVIIKADDAAGFYPQMDISRGVKMFVDKQNLQEAQELLEPFNESADNERE